MKTLRTTGYLRPLNRHPASEHLILASDGHCYSTNLKEPWGTGSSILNALGTRFCQVAEIETAPPMLLNVDTTIMELAVRGTGATCRGGVYLGNRYPFDPAMTTIYDFLPDSLLDRVENRGDFWKLLPIHLWLGNSQASKVLFYRTAPKSLLYRSTMMFRSIPQLISSTRGVPADEDLPRFTTRHYCGSEGRIAAERTAALLLSLDIIHIEALFTDLLGDEVYLFAPTIYQLIHSLLLSREAIFARLPMILRIMQHRADAAESSRKGPGTEVACSNVTSAFDEATVAAG